MKRLNKHKSSCNPSDPVSCEACSAAIAGYVKANAKCSDQMVRTRTNVPTDQELSRVKPNDEKTKWKSLVVSTQKNRTHRTRKTSLRTAAVVAKS